MKEIGLVILMLCSTTGRTSAWKARMDLKGEPFWKFWILSNRFILTSDIKKSSQIITEKLFDAGDVNDAAIVWL